MVMRLNDGLKSSGSIVFSEFSDAQYRMISCLDDACSDDLVITEPNQPYGFGSRACVKFGNKPGDKPGDKFSWGLGKNGWEIGVRIPISHTDPTTFKATCIKSYAYSNDPSVIRLFFEGNFGPLLYNRYPDQDLD
jgi:hypothetical protein